MIGDSSDLAIKSSRRSQAGRSLRIVGVVAGWNEGPALWCLNVQPPSLQYGPIDRAFRGVLARYLDLTELGMFEHVLEELVPGGGGLGGEAVPIDQFIADEGALFVSTVHNA